jgi:Uma2 family endonuclease
VEGRILLRSEPQKLHSKMQTYLVRTLYALAHPLGYEVWVEQRLRTQPDPARYRVPDVCVTLGEPAENIFTEPPFLCAEVLSPDDTASDVRTKVDEYLAFGVAYVWIIDPTARRGEIHTSLGIQRVENGKFRAGEIEVDIHNV